MKKFLPILLILCLFLTACKKTEPTPTQPDTTPTTEATVPETTEATEPAVEYRNPLNGAALTSAWTGRPTAVVVNNLKYALPQYGINDADFFYELETEGGITRCLAVYSDITKVDTVGPIRSARTFFNNIALSYDAPIIHCGGSVRGRNAGFEDSNAKIENWEHIDQVYNGNYFFRDEDRYYYQGYNWEHTLFAKGKKLYQGLQDKEMAAPTSRSEDFGLLFDEKPLLNGSPATELTVYFRGDKTTGFVYDEATGTYKASQYGTDWVDAGHDSTAMSFRNVIVLYTDQWNRHDGEYSRSYYTLSGSGNGLLAIDGKLVPITWSRDDLRTSFSYQLTDGTPVTLGTGHTYVAVADVTSQPAEYK